MLELHPALRFIVASAVFFCFLQGGRLFVRLFRPVGEVQLYDELFGYPTDLFISSLIGLEFVLLPYLMDVIANG